MASLLRDTVTALRQRAGAGQPDLENQLDLSGMSVAASKEFETKIRYEDQLGPEDYSRVPRVTKLLEGFLTDYAQPRLGISATYESMAGVYVSRDSYGLEHSWRSTIDIPHDLIMKWGIADNEGAIPEADLIVLDHITTAEAKTEGVTGLLILRVNETATGTGEPEKSRLTALSIVRRDCDDDGSVYADTQIWRVDRFVPSVTLRQSGQQDSISINDVVRAIWCSLIAVPAWSICSAPWQLD